MEQEFKQGYRMHCVLSNLNRLISTDWTMQIEERVERARALLEEVSLLTRPADGDGTDARADT